MLGLVGRGARDDLADVAVLRAGRPHLLARDDPFVAVALGLRLDPGEVGAGDRFREELAADEVAAVHRGGGNAPSPPGWRAPGSSARPCRARCRTRPATGSRSRVRSRGTRARRRPAARAPPYSSGPVIQPKPASNSFAFHSLAAATSSASCSADFSSSRLDLVGALAPLERLFDAALGVRVEERPGVGPEVGFGDRHGSGSLVRALRSSFVRSSGRHRDGAAMLAVRRRGLGGRLCGRGGERRRGAERREHVTERAERVAPSGHRVQIAAEAELPRRRARLARSPHRGASRWQWLRPWSGRPRHRQPGPPTRGRHRGRRRCGGCGRDRRRSARAAPGRRARPVRRRPDREPLGGSRRARRPRRGTGTRPRRATLGGTRLLFSHRARAYHRSVPAPTRRATGVPPSLLEVGGRVEDRVVELLDAELGPVARRRRRPGRAAQRTAGAGARRWKAAPAGVLPLGLRRRRWRRR